MAKNVKFYYGTRAQYDNLAERDELALYFCDDTGELFKGNVCMTDAIRIVSTYSDLPECHCCADGVLYYVSETRNGYMVSPDRTEWLQTIYAPATDAYIVPESEIYNTVTTVGAVRDIEKKIYEYINEVSSSGVGNLTPVDGSLFMTDSEDGGKMIGVAISQESDNALVIKDDGLYITSASIKIADESHGLVAVEGALLINLATTESDGAMSKEDKSALEELKTLNISNTYATKEEVQIVADTLSNVEQCYTWGEM